MNRLGFGNISLWFLVSALLCLVVADITVTALNPWGEMLRLLRGILRPDTLSIEAWSVVWTIAFAVVGVGIGATAGFVLAIAFPHVSSVRGLAVVLRGIHELFWALLLIQVFGIGPATGVLAIAIPYAGIFAKVFAEMIEEADFAAEKVFPSGTSAISAFAFARLPDVAERFKTYTLYRLECGLRSTLVLGFVGLPTVGFHLEGYFKQGKYAEATALLGVFYVLIGTRRLWARPTTVPLLFIGSLLLLPEGIGGGSALTNLARFVTHDIVPTPFRNGDVASLATWSAFAAWLQPIVWHKVLPGVWNTIVLAQIALVGTGMPGLAPVRRAHRPAGRPRAARCSAIYARIHAGLRAAASAGTVHAAGDHRPCRAQRCHRRLPDGAARGCLRLPHGCPEGDQSLRLRYDPAPVWAVSGIQSLPLGNHRARERDLRNSWCGDAGILR